MVTNDANKIAEIDLNSELSSKINKIYTDEDINAVVKLPDGFQAKEYIGKDTNKGVAIDTGVYASSDIAIEGKILIGGKGMAPILSGRRYSEPKMGLHIYTTSTKLGAISGSSSCIVDPYDRTNPITFRLDNTQFVYNDQVIAEFEPTSYSVDWTIRLFVAHQYYKGANDYDEDYCDFSNIRFYWLKIYDKGDLIRDFVPCTDSNGVACLYDLVTRTAFYNRFADKSLPNYQDGYAKPLVTGEDVVITRGNVDDVCRDLQKQIDSGSENNTQISFKCFKPITEDTELKTITLDSVTGLKIGQQLVKAMYTDGEFTGWQSREIKAIDSTTNVVTLLANFSYHPNYTEPYTATIKNGVVFYESLIDTETGKAIGSTNLVSKDDDIKYIHLEGVGNNGVLSSTVEGSYNIASAFYSHAEGSWNVASGIESHVEGTSNTASGKRAHVEGSGNTASGQVSHAEGSLVTASGNYSHGEGLRSQAIGERSHAEGYRTETHNYSSHAEGESTIAKGWAGHSEGKATQAIGNYSHAEGNGTYANGEASHSEGNGTYANGEASHSEGNGTKASGADSHAEGNGTEASGDYSHSEGESTVASGIGSHAEGGIYRVKDKETGKVTEEIKNQAKGIYSHTEGAGNVISGNYSHAEGYRNTIAFNGEAGHVEGAMNEVSGGRAHAEGEGCKAKGNFSHAEGKTTQAIGHRTHTEGESTIANGQWSHAEGHLTVTNGTRSHAEGWGTIATRDSSHVQGAWNIEDVDGQYLHIVGNGESANARSNAHTVDKDGNAWYAGEVTVGENKDKLATEKYFNEIYYGDINITPTDSSLFTFDKDTGSITGYTGNQSSIVIPYQINGATVKKIGKKAFHENKIIRDVILPKSVTSVGDNAFVRCTSLTNITIPNSVTSIGMGAFIGCTGLTNITIPNSVTSITQGAFSGCTSLINIIIPGNVTTISYSAFSKCTNLKNITIPDSVTTIREKAFEDCTSLTNITIPDSVTSIDSYAFEGCMGLEIHCSQGSYAETFAIANGYDIIYTEIDKANNLQYYGDTNIIPTRESLFTFDKDTGSITGYTGDESDIVIPYQIGGVTVKCIGKEAFQDNTGIANVVIPKSVTSIEDSAFENCGGLKKVVIPNSVTAIGGFAFYGCTSLEKITIPNSVKTISTSMLGHTGLTDITIPCSVSSINNGAFEGCASLTDVDIPCSVTSIGDYVFVECTNLMNMTIPNSVTRMGQGVFSGCRNLTNITISNNITSIGSGMFSNCDNITNIIIPSSVTVIGSYAFQNCIGLTEITIPDDVINIYDGAFSDCVNLKKVTVQSENTRLGDWVFVNCNSDLVIYSLKGSYAEEYASENTYSFKYIDKTKIILMSPNGTKFSISVDDNGSLKATKI